MKRILVFAAAALMTGSAYAQSFINRTPSRTSSSGSSFSIGPRYSNYSTDVDADVLTLKTGRQAAFGVSGDYRTGIFVLDFMYDHDPENGLSIVDLIGIDVGKYARDRGEVMFGISALPFLDLKGGVRAETVRVGGAEIFGNNLFSTLDFDHQALAFGARVHTTSDRPFGLYADGRGYVGTAKFKESGVHLNTDTTGYRGEAGIAIPLGDSKWTIVPAIEYEHIETKDLGLRLDTNRLLLNFIYHSRF